MTGAFEPPSSGLSPGVQPGQEGLILQRGGEELALLKVEDRFTFSPMEGVSPDATIATLNPEAVMPIPGWDLMEVQVSPENLDTAMRTARDADAIAFSSHVYQVEGNPETLLYLTDEITLQFAPSVDMDRIRAIAATVGLEGIKPIREIPQTYVFQVTRRATENPIKIANHLMRMPEVLVAEPNIITYSEKLYRPQEPDYRRQWHLQNQGGAQISSNSHISVEAAWDITRGERSVVIAVTDDAFDLNHPDFQGVGKMVAPQDLKGRDRLPLPEESHENHGTACAGVAIAEENNTGAVGVAPGCSFLPIRTTGFLDDRSIEDLFDWAVQQGAWVISCSWGASATYFSLSLRQRAAITRAARQGREGKGCVILFAAGNANRPVSGTINERGWTGNALQGNTNWLNGFAVHPDVISVSATTSLGKKAAYSNWGDAISISAPSNNAPPGVWLPQSGYVFTGPRIQSALPGLGVVTSDRTGRSGYEGGDLTSTFGGTSSACPIVAGVAGLVLSINPFLTAQEVRQILQDTADKLVDSASDPQLGFSYGSYNAKGHSRWFGYGKVNAARAVKTARDRIPTPLIPNEWKSVQNSAVVQIPDFNLRGTGSLIRVQENLLLRDIRVTVDVEHDYLGDVDIRLQPPSGEAVLLQSRTLGRATRLQFTYTLKTTPQLRNLLGRSPRGTWQLRLTDHAPNHTGSLRGWRISVGV